MLGCVDRSLKYFKSKPTLGIISKNIDRIYLKIALCFYSGKHKYINGSFCIQFAMGSLTLDLYTSNAMTFINKFSTNIHERYIGY